MVYSMCVCVYLCAHVHAFVCKEGIDNWARYAGDVQKIGCGMWYVLLQ